MVIQVRHPLALVFMVGSVGLHSLIPAGLFLLGGISDPFLFNGMWRLGLGMGCLFILVPFYSRVVRAPGFFRAAGRGIFTWAMFWAVLQSFDYSLFGLASGFADIALVNVLFGVWPIFFILVISRIFRGWMVQQKSVIGILPFLLTALFGFALVIASGSDSGLNDLVSVSGDYGDVLIGAALALAGALAVSLGAFPFRWSRETGARLQAAGIVGTLDGRYLLFGAVLGFGISSIIGSGINLAIGSFFLSESFGGRSFLFAAVLGGLAINAPASILLRQANLLTDNPGINALIFATPVLSLVWLFMLDAASAARVDYLVMGTIAIVIANLLINFEAEIRWGFKALLLGLGACGAAVYLREEVFSALGSFQWHWTAGGYFESITLSATLFILLLAFRVSRLVSRTADEDSRTFLVYRKLNLLSRRGVVRQEICRYFLEIDHSRNNSAAEEESYLRVRQILAEVDPAPLEEADIQLLGDVEAQLDALARSKQADLHLGEMFALIVFGGITVGLALGSTPPGLEGWSRFLVDLVAMSLSAVIVFLLVHLYDLQRERDQPRLQSVGDLSQYRHYSVGFYDIARRSFDQWFSVVVGLTIVAAYAALLGHKWLGWF